MFYNDNIYSQCPNMAVKLIGSVGPMVKNDKIRAVMLMEVMGII